LIQVLDEVLNEAPDEVLREVLNEVSALGVNLCVMFRIYEVFASQLMLGIYALGGAFRLVIQHQA
jgi:uncharacterized protein YbjQ (UPF0145 family)